MHGALDCPAVVEFPGDDDDVGVSQVELGRVADIGGDLVAAVEGLGDNFTTNAAGGAEHGELQHPASRSRAQAPSSASPSRRTTSSVPSCSRWASSSEANSAASVSFCARDAL